MAQRVKYTITALSLLARLLNKPGWTLPGVMIVRGAWSLGLLVLLGGGPARAQSGDGYDLSWNTIDSGGERSIGSDYEVSGTIGQPDAGAMAGGGFTLAGGFWPGFCVPVPYGDVYPQDGGDGNVDLDDILCVLDGFANPAWCPGADIYPCAPDGNIDLDDILAVLDAFAGFPACPAPCR